MFASRWEQNVPFAPNWLTNSEVVRAVADVPEGPYGFAEHVLPPRGKEFWDGRMTHNPTIHKAGDTYLLYYTGTTYPEPTPTKPGQVDPEWRLRARANQRIGLATSNSIFGPWHRPAAPLLDSRPGCWDGLMTTNPAPCLLENGSVLLLYKSTADQGTPIQYGVAAADTWDGPYERLSDDPILQFDEGGVSYEDAYLWRENGMFQMIFNDIHGKITGEHHGGAWAVSEDGLNWRLGDPVKAYSRTVRWNNGTETVEGNVERPQLLIQDGVPTHLFAATANNNGWYADATETWNMVFPLD